MDHFHIVHESSMKLKLKMQSYSSCRCVALLAASFARLLLGTSSITDQFAISAPQRASETLSQLASFTAAARIDISVVLELECILEVES